jgi:hypothetical protein
VKLFCSGGGDESLASWASRQRARNAVKHAVSLGFVIGREVKIGTAVSGVVVGYNIGACGSFPGSEFPLLVETHLGVVKLSLSEIELA